MAKILVAIVSVGLIGFIIFHKVANPPLDARAAIDDGISQIRSSTDLKPEQEEVLRLQLAISDYMASTGSPPPSLQALVPKYFDVLPKDPSTGNVFDYVVDENNAPRLGAQVSAPVRVASAGGAEELKDVLDKLQEEEEEGFINPNTLELEEFVYDPRGRRDPYEPFYSSTATAVDLSKPPLERYSLDQLQVTAILADEGEMIAVVEDTSGRGYTVKKGARIGNANGVVVSVEKAGVNVVETTTDITGKVTNHPTVMKIKTQEDPALVGNQNSRR